MKNSPFDYQNLDDQDFTALFAEYPKFKQWFNVNTNAHKSPKAIVL